MSLIEQCLAGVVLVLWIHFVVAPMSRIVAKIMFGDKDDED